MSWVTLHTSLLEHKEQCSALLDDSTRMAAEAVRAMGASLKKLALQSDEQSRTAHARRRAIIDLPSLRAKVGAEAWDLLTPQEIRAVPRFFLEFPPNAVHAFLRAFPGRKTELLRHLARQWSFSVSREAWEPYCDAVAAVASIGGTPLRPALSLVRKSAPRDIAATCSASSLEDFAGQLGAEGIRTGELLGAFLIALLERKLTLKVSVGRDVDWLTRNPAMSSLLLPTLRNRPDAERQGSTELQERAVAALLSCKHAGLLSPSSGEAFEKHLLARDSSFGDPRLGRTLHWQRVRELAPQAYDSFLQTLIREDLVFFFERAMKIEERARFWLRYLKSIRRTVCWLDTESRRGIEMGFRDLPREHKSAFSRSQPLRGTISAFCLYFDGLVVVEFSNTGHAAYAYDEATFEQRLFDSKRTPTHESDFKSRTQGSQWPHRGDWEDTFARNLRAHGIRPG